VYEKVTAHLFGLALPFHIPTLLPLFLVLVKREDGWQQVLLLLPLLLLLLQTVR
jgi:hypothetical protein